MSEQTPKVLTEEEKNQVSLLESSIKRVGDNLREKKIAKADKDALAPLIEELKKLKLEVSKITGVQEKKKGGGGGGQNEAQKKRAEEKARKAEQTRLNMEKNAAKKKQKVAKPKIEYVNKTPKGEKKNVVEEEMLSAYHPPAVEAAWYDWWEKKGFFKPENENGEIPDNPKGQFVMVIPPPNVTGALHLGHALTNAIEDTLCRWHRMLGKTVLWNPGCDHAGIATQVVVEKKLWKEKQISRHELGREKFLEHVWEWKQEFGEKIYDQLRKLGTSFDWERACFTMDPKMVNAVKEAFFRLHGKGLIKRANRLVNWSPALKSAISDLEVDHIELPGRTMMAIKTHDNKEYEFGVMTEFMYKVENTGEEIIIATTRPETILGDTCLAVHPADDRWKHLHGKYCVHPFTGRRMPIIPDECVDISLGTGAMKITPGHDKKDFDFGVRHNQPVINILNDDGTINGICAQFEGMKRYDCRNAIVEALKEKGLFVDAKSHAMTIPICSRSKDVVEDMVRPQWFMDIDDMAARALKAVHDKDLKIIPSTHEITWQRWLESPRDWCISRQLWWGHRIPAYKILIDGKEPPSNDESNDEGSWVVARSDEEAMNFACEKFNTTQDHITLAQDPDVLDTWFSAGLFPFSIFGWPEKTPDFEKFFPTSLLETGHDILFFWVARMVMMSLALTDKLPFDSVYLHAMVRDAHGRKMSKSLGNVIDPLDVISGVSLEMLVKKLKEGNLSEEEVKKAEKGQRTDFPSGIPECGTDSLRFTLVSYTMGGKNVNLDVNKIVANRHFCNKIWNCTKLYFMYCSSFKPAEEFVKPTDSYSSVDKWILSRLFAAVKTVNEGFENYHFPQVTESVLRFWKDELCDVYLEAAKPALQGPEGDAKKSAMETLYTCIETGLRLLHPIMPFVTEELWQRMPKRSNSCAESICIAEYPEHLLYFDIKLEEQHSLAMEVTKNLRLIRNSYLEPRARPTATIVPKTDSSMEAIQIFKSMIGTLCETGELIVSSPGEVDKRGCAVGLVGDKAEILLLIKGLVDPEKEVEKLNKQKKTVQTNVEKLEKRFASPSAAKTPAAIMEKEKERYQAYKNELLQIEESLKFYAEMEN